MGIVVVHGSAATRVVIRATRRIDSCMVVGRIDPDEMKPGRY